MKEMDKILDYLKQLELSDEEATLYLTLLQTGPLSVKSLAEEVDIKRTTSYIYINTLIQKGLIVKVVKGAQKMVAANDPQECLQDLVKKKILKAEAIKENFSTMLSAMTASMSTINDIADAEIKYYKGENGVAKIYEEALRANELRTYVNLTELYNLLTPNNIKLENDLFEKALSSNPTLKIFELIAETPDVVKKFNLDDTSKNERYTYKLMPDDVGLTSPGILLYDNSVAIINGKETLTSVILRNTEYYINSKKLFDLIWRLLPESK